MTGRKVWPMDLVKPVEAAPAPVEDTKENLGPVVKALSVDVVPEILDIETLKMPPVASTKPIPTPADIWTQLDEFSITLKGSHCVYGVLFAVLLALGLYLWHLNARIQGLEALIVASAHLNG